MTNTLKIAIGLALKSELYRGRMNPRLYDLYSNPQLESVQKYYQELIVSEYHQDREAAFWLELAIPQTPLRIDLATIINVLRKMEVLLYDLLWKVDPRIQKKLNDWVNYIANIPHMLESGSGLDAKLFISQALDCSKIATIELIKHDPTIVNKIRILQQETQHLYQEILRIPLKLIIPDKQQELVLTLQQIIIDLLQLSLKYTLNPTKLHPSLQNLERAQTHLMTRHFPHQTIKQDIAKAVENLQFSHNNTELCSESTLLTRIIEDLRTVYSAI